MNKKIDGSLFMYLILVGIGLLFGWEYMGEKFKEAAIFSLIVIYGIWNVVGIICMIGNYQGEDKYQRDCRYYWDENHWFWSRPDKTKTDSHWSFPQRFCFFRLTSILAWVAFIFFKIHLWFSRNLSIKIT